MNATHLWTRIVRSTGAAAGIVGLALATSSAWGGVTIASAKSDGTKTCSSDVVRDVAQTAQTSTASSDTTGDDHGQGKDNGKDKDGSSSSSSSSIDKDKDKDKDCSSSSSSSSKDSSTSSTNSTSSTEDSSGTSSTTLPIVILPTPTPTPHVQGPVTLGPAATAIGVVGSVDALQTHAPNSGVAATQTSAPAPTPNTGAGTPLEGGLLLMFGGISLLLAEKMGRVVTR